MIQLPQQVLEKFLIDPVMAAYVLLGFELDTFQAARLRIYWWVPNVIDSSGVSTGKTVVQFCYVMLRCMLLPQHTAAIYFPNFQTAKDVYWPYIQVALNQSEVFASSLKSHNGKLGEHRDPGTWWLEFKDGNRMMVPAPGYLQDAQGSASRRFNTLVIDEWLVAENMGDAISRHLASRVTAPAFNQHHPVWQNHSKFLGHAESPMHRGYGRYQSYRRFITDGSQEHAVISFCHLDWSDKPFRGTSFKKRFLPEKTVNEARKIKLASGAFHDYMQEYLGIWSRGGSNYYPETVLMRCCRRELIPVWGRQFEVEMNSFGFDVARGASVKADWSAGVVYRIVEIVKNDREANNLPVNRVVGTRGFNCAFTFAHMFRNADGPQTAAFIHLMDSVFVFSKIVIDPQGGGLWIYPELKKERLLVDGVEKKFIPLCTRAESIQGDKRPVIAYFQRQSEFDPLIEREYLVSPDGFIAAWHLRYRQAWEAGQLAHPLPVDERDPAELRAWPQQIFHSLRYLSIGLKQLNNVRQLTDKDGQLITSKRGGFPLYRAVGKKDVAYAGLYAWCGGELLLSGDSGADEEDPEDCFGTA